MSSSATKFLLWELHSASQQQAARALSCVCEHLGFVWVYSVHPLVRCVLWYLNSLKEGILEVWECSKFFPYKLMATVSLLYTILTYKSFQSNALFSDSRGHVRSIIPFLLKTIFHVSTGMCVCVQT